MNRREFFFSGVCAWFPFFCRNSITLADMRFHVRRKGHSGRRYLHIHGNEDTARDVLNVHMRTYPGIAYLIDNHDRNVNIHGSAIDPNRLFSRTGADRSLRDLNPGISPQQLESVLSFLDHHRENLIRHLEPEHGDLLFALHNNRNYSVTEELNQSDDTSIRQKNHPREFFLCTDPRDFAILRKSPYNVVLQNHKPATDDGSLSRLAAHRSFRYVNLECALGERDAQTERVNWLEANLPHNY